MKDYIPKILLIDDIPQNIQVLGSFLSELNYHLSFATSATEALRLTSVNTYDLILLDIMMPDMDGFELCEKIKQNENLIDIPIIFISARTDHESILKGFTTGGVDYITKPFNSHELLARVKTHIELRKQKLLLSNINTELEDIVMQRTLELRNANKQLLSLDQAKNNFLQLISHELRTPLNNITLMIDVLKMKLVEDKYSNYIFRIEDSVRKLIDFAELALLITTLSTSLKDLSWNKIYVKDLFKNVLVNFQNEITSKKIIVVNNINSTDIQFEGEYGLIEKCIEILISNAIKFSSNEGRIYFSASSESGFVTITIKDEGKGFDKSILENLFSAFTVSEIDHHQQGFGLSLKLANLIINAHQGQITIKNNTNISGATVQLIFKEKL